MWRRHLLFRIYFLTHFFCASSRIPIRVILVSFVEELFLYKTKKNQTSAATHRGAIVVKPR